MIDLGMHADGGNAVVAGDVDCEAVLPRCSLISTVPGGIAPVVLAVGLRSVVQGAVRLARLGRHHTPPPRREPEPGTSKAEVGGDDDNDKGGGDSGGGAGPLETETEGG